MAVYTYAALALNVQGMVTGDIGVSDLLLHINAGVRDVLSDVDIRSSIRRSALAPNMFDEVYQYTCPTDLKADKIIDVQPQKGRGRFDQWDLLTEEEFDRRKSDRREDEYGDEINFKDNSMGDNIVAILTRDMVRKILLSRLVDDHEIVIADFDAVGDWVLYGDGTNLTADLDNYIKGSGAINWDISAAGGVTAGIYNDDLDAFDISDYKSLGSVFVWAYITSATNLTNFILRIGSSSTVYYTITITTNNEGNAFEAGWNLLRFDFANKVATGTPTDTAITYVALYMTKDGAKISETDYRFDWLTMKRGENYWLKYYSKYLWQSNAAVWIENSTATTDYVNADTDEIELIQTKIAERLQRYVLKDSKEADVRKREYEEKKQKYIFNNPSQAILLTQKTWDFNW